MTARAIQNQSELRLLVNNLLNSFFNQAGWHLSISLRLTPGELATRIPSKHVNNEKQTPHPGIHLAYINHKRRRSRQVQIRGLRQDKVRARAGFQSLD